MIRLFSKRVLSNKIYWLAVLSALILLLCSVIYNDPSSGQKYTFLSLFYAEEMQMLLQYGRLSIPKMLSGYGISNYVWMFCPIIVGIPCVLNQKTERFMLFRGSKNGYFLSKYISNLVLGGGILVVAYLLFAVAGTGVIHCVAATADVSFTQETIWDVYLVQKLVSVFCEGMVNALPGILLAEFLQNKYLILCIPFVWSYFISTFAGSIIPSEIWRYISPSSYGVLLYHEPPEMLSSVFILVVEILACGILIKCNVERRCDCGQK